MDSYLPPEWSDDDRMRFLMGPLPLEKDEVQFKSRVTFWTAALKSWSEKQNKLSFTINDAQMAFRRGTQLPICLPQIIEYLVKKGDFSLHESLTQPLQEYESWSSWSRKVLSRPPQWVWTIIQRNVMTKNNLDMVVIDSKILQERSAQLLSTFWSLPQNTKSSFMNSTEENSVVLSAQELYSCVGSSLLLSLDDFELMILYLSRKRCISVAFCDGQTIVKILPPACSTVPQITEIELADFKLKQTEGKLQQRIHILQEEIEGLRNSAKSAIGRQDKKQAMSLLRRKKRSEKALETAYSASENVNSCLLQLQESKLNREVVTAFGIGVSALRSHIASSGTADDVTSTMDALADVLAECSDISEELSTSPLSGGEASERESTEELEKELEALLLVRKNNDNPSSGLTLPSVPENNPLDIVFGTENKQILDIFQ